HRLHLSSNTETSVRRLRDRDSGNWRGGRSGLEKGRIIESVRVGTSEDGISAKKVVSVGTGVQEHQVAVGCALVVGKSNSVQAHSARISEQAFEEAPCVVETNYDIVSAPGSMGLTLCEPGEHGKHILGRIRHIGEPLRFRE